MKNLIGVLTLTALCAFPQATPDARDLLARSAGGLFAAGTMRVVGRTVQVDERSGAQQSSDRTFRVEAVRGGRGRREFTTFDGTQSDTFDGAMLSHYTSQNNTYTQRQATGLPDTAEIRALDFGRTLGNILTASVEGEDSLEFGGKPTPCYMVRASYKGYPGRPNDENVVRRVWIARDNMQVLRDSWERDLAGGSPAVKRRETTTYSTIELDIPLAGDLFVFRPPEGSRVASPYPVTGGVLPPPVAPIRKVEPEYSPEARDAGLQGSVFLTVEIGSEGRVESVRVNRHLGIGLDEQAIAAVKQWEYPPQPGKSKTTLAVEVPFRLAPAGSWSIDGSSFIVNSGTVHADKVSKPVLSRYTHPDDRLCTADREYVAFSMQIDAAGKPDNVNVTTSRNPALNQAVAKAVQSWRFQPAKVNGDRRPANARMLLECRTPGSVPAEPVGEVLRGGNGTTPPSMVFKVEPEYSEEARKAKYQGSVTLALVVEPSGKPSSIRVVRALGLGLDEKAIEAVQQWRFVPGTKDGKPVRVFAQVEVNFKLL